jgi:hypothetical protein
MAGYLYSPSHRPMNIQIEVEDHPYIGNKVYLSFTMNTF